MLSTGNEFADASAGAAAKGIAVRDGIAAEIRASKALAEQVQEIIGTAVQLACQIAKSMQAINRIATPKVRRDLDKKG